MPTEEEWQKFKEQIINLLESQRELNETFWRAIRTNFKTWREFLKIFTGIIVFLMIFISRKELSKLIVLIWQSLSEIWQTTLFLAFWSLFLIFISIFIDRKYIHKPTNSETSQNRKKDNEDE